MAFSPSARTRTAALRAVVGAAVLAAALAGCGASPSTGEPLSSPPSHDAAPTPGTVIMIIRHGEKPDSTSPGVDANGHPDSSSLTQTGWARARKLAEVFAPSTGETAPGLYRPKTIYAAGANDNGEGTRTRETVAPLAQRLGIAVDTGYGKGNENALVADATTRPGPTLICWQHGEIPALARAFGSVAPTPPARWPSNRFDVIWTFTATATGWKFNQLPESALATDQVQGIPG